MDIIKVSMIMNLIDKEYKRYCSKQKNNITAF